ncbi:autophagy-related protein 17 [Helicostylum pulchrum]|nr:autophagy-related protein 17 [Helicostylum pulchrum]
MSNIVIQQELVSLLVVAKKAFSQGRDMCNQANIYQQSSQKYIETIERIHPKLLFVDNHISLQLKDLDSMRNYLDAGAETCKNRIKDRETRLQSLTIELTNIFNLLKECTIDKDILKVNEERGGKSQNEVTLFDYISDQEIIELQRLADDEIGEIETIHSSLLNQTKNMSNVIQELQSSKDKTSSISLDDSISNFANEKIQLQEEESLKMADILTSLMKHFDQVQEATRISQLGPEECAKLDISILKADDDSLQNIIEELRIGLDAVIFTSEEIYDRMQVYLRVKDELIKVLNQLDQIGIGADAIYDKLLDFESEIKEREDNLDEFFEQLKSLVEWYRCYASSYNYLLLEIDRRKSAQEKQDQLKNELLKSFEAAYNDELQERRSWSAQHGQYLPEVLCPFIKDAPSILTVAIESDVVTRLPNLSRSSVEKALSEIHSDHN